MCKLKPLLQKWLQFAVKGSEYPFFNPVFDASIDQSNGFSALEKAANTGRKRKKRPSHEVRGVERLLSSALGGVLAIFFMERTIFRLKETIWKC